MDRQTIKNAGFLYKSSLIPSKSSSPLFSAIDGSRVYSTNSFTVLPSFTPVKVYVNADKDKILILKENKGKCGIYRWTNITNGRSYVGSSVNLERRLKCHYNIYFLETAIKKGRAWFIVVC
uniref:Truncated GIY-YIG endonuclease n=1 Tax=Sclerotinia borealis TaxID=77105 RepID=A0A088CRV0_9HELO|nr:truncated GIY-YIG endonuclease [Sclerotinia borealis]AIJ56805.1 truncated GIY-YIG endonuclease [Sclerotinia borealis]